MKEKNPYASFLKSASRKQWELIGVRRRAGVAVPLFSVHSSASVGIGELPDIKKLADWCASTGLSIIQLLPLNDVGFDFQPYSAQSSFALDPMYLSLAEAAGEDQRFFTADINRLKAAYPASGPRVNYSIKAAKLNLLWKIFQRQGAGDEVSLRAFANENRFWLKDYALFKALKEFNEEKSWELWDPSYKGRDSCSLESFENERRESVRFHVWLQWKLFKQFKDAKDHARRRGVLLMGDLPFLVSRDSADTWAHQGYFRWDVLSGAPPDMYFAAGQRWGMPPYRWNAIAAHDYDYLAEKLRFAQTFYDLFRVDHVIGVFRLWTIAVNEPSESGGTKGVFDPENEKEWEEHGRNLLKVMLQRSLMLPCGEDLGVVPKCSYAVLKELSIPGIDVQRWTRDWEKTYGYKPPRDYRKNSVSVISSHDMSVLAGWWKHETGTVDEELFKRKCAGRRIDFNAVKDKLFDLSKSRFGRLRWKDDVKSVPILLWNLGKPESEVKDFIDLYKGSFNERERFWAYVGLKGKPDDEATAEFVRRSLDKALASASIFSVQLMQDWLSLQAGLLPGDPWTWRINFPGATGDQNWTYVLPLSLEDLERLPVNPAIRKLIEGTDRA